MVNSMCPAFGQGTGGTPGELPWKGTCPGDRWKCRRTVRNEDMEFYIYFTESGAPCFTVEITTVKQASNQTGTSLSTRSTWKGLSTMSKPANGTESVDPPKHVEVSEQQDYEKTTTTPGDNETAKYTAGAPTEIDAKTNRKLFWMVNRRVLFIMLGTYFCQSLDKGTLNFASIMGIKEDANLKGQEVSIAGCWWIERTVVLTPA